MAKSLVKRPWTILQITSAPACCWGLTICIAVKAEIAIFDNVIVLYKFIGDLMFFVTVSQDENELLMYTVLEGFHESVSLLLR